MSLKRIAIKLLQLGQPSDTEEVVPKRRVAAAAQTPLSIVAAVAVGGVLAGMPLSSILICALVAGGGVALLCAAAAWLSTYPCVQA
jgi:hypothetical protein